MAGVILTYQSIFPPKRPNPSINSQVISNKEDIVKPASFSEIPAVNLSDSPKVDFKEKSWDISTPIFNMNVENVGGALHNIEIDEGHFLPLQNLVTVKGVENSEFHLFSQNDQQSILVYKGQSQKITKTIETVDPNSIKVTIEIASLDNSISNLANLEFILFDIDGTKIDTSDKRATLLDEYSLYDGKKVFRKNHTLKFSSKEDKNVTGRLKWAGFRDHFNAVVIHPDFESKAYEIKSVTEKTLRFSLQPQSGGEGRYEFFIFIGPQDASLMKKSQKEFEKIVAFSSFAPFQFVAHGLYVILPMINKVAHSWGLTIILVALLVYFVTYPLTIKSMMSMRRMQQVQPKIKALQDRYKNDPQKLNSEVMAIYRREKINPMGGCLPLFLQILISYPAYQVLSRSFYFKGQSFLWIKDLTHPDKLFILPFSLPLMGNQINILPILMAALMFIQQKIASKTMVITDEQQAMQQKMLMYMIPVILGVTFYHFASGISLYFIFFYLLSTLTQWKMNKAKV